MPMKKVLLLLFVLATFIMSACGGGGGSSSSSGSSAGTASEYFPTAVGTTHTYRYTTALSATVSNTGDQTETITASSLNGSNLEVTVTSGDLNSSNNESTTTKYVWKNKGLYMTSMSSTAANNLGTPQTFTVTFIPEVLQLPSSLASGTHESSTTTATSFDVVSQTTGSSKGSIDIVVNGAEDVTVPAGTYHTIKLTMAYSSPSSTSANTITEWIAKGVGVVKSSQTVGTPQNAITNTRELTYFSATGGTPPPPTGSAPTITGINPTSGAVGTSFVISGTNFSSNLPDNTVTINGIHAPVAFSTTTSINVTIPIGATTGTITVTTAGGTATSTTMFTVTGAAPPAGNLSPTITNINPVSGAVGTVVTITGTNFSATPAGNTIKFNGTLAPATIETATMLKLRVPTGATTGKVTVATATGTATSTGTFTVTVPTGGMCQSSGPCSISGIQKDTAGKPVSGATAKIVSNSKVFSVLSDSTGYYDLVIPSADAYYLPDMFTYSVSKTGYVPLSYKGAKNTTNYNDTTPMVPIDNTYVVFEIEPLTHHLGDSSYSGTQNSQFQYASAEGLTFSKTFTLTSQPTQYPYAYVTLLHKGINSVCQNTIGINLTTSVLPSSDANGGYSELNLKLPTSGFKANQSNTLAIKSGACTSTDHDDFEFQNVIIKFGN